MEDGSSMHRLNTTWTWSTPSSWYAPYTLCTIQKCIAVVWPNVIVRSICHSNFCMISYKYLYLLPYNLLVACNKFLPVNMFLRSGRSQSSSNDSMSTMLLACVCVRKMRSTCTCTRSVGRSAHARCCAISHLLAHFVQNSTTYWVLLDFSTQRNGTWKSSINSWALITKQQVTTTRLLFKFTQHKKVPIN